MNRHKQTYTRITPLNPPELAGRRKRRELAGERPVEDQAAYLDRSEVDAAEPLTDTAFDEGELLTGDVAAPLDAAELSTARTWSCGPISRLACSRSALAPSWPRSKTWNC